MFSGSDDFNHTYINAMEKIGATNLNGTTNNDRTNYFENVPTSMLDYVLFAESDRMGHLLGVLDQKKLDLQRGVVQNEKRQGENQPYGVTDQLIVENTYPVGHPYSWTVIGSMKDLDAASMGDVQEWFKTYYGPNNVTVVIAGDITPEVAREKAEKYYGDIPAGPPIAKQEVWIAKRTGTHRGWVQDRVPQGRLYRVWNVPEFGSAEEPLLDLAAEVLGQGKTSRLYKRLVYRDQIATSATSSNDTNEIGGQFDFTLTANPGEELNKVEKAADEELRNFLKNGPSPAELQLAKTQILGRYARIVERIGGFGGKSDLLARCQTYRGNPDCYKDYLKWVKAATPATVKKAANDWLSDGDYVLEVHPYPTTFKTEGNLDRSKEPPVGEPMSLKLPPLQKSALSNGLKIVLAERHTAPVVNFTLMVDSGYSADPADATGTASFEQRMLEEGTPTRDSLKIGEELAALSANFTATRQSRLLAGQPEHAQEHDGSVAGYLCGSHSASRISAEGIPAPAKRAAGHHSTREGDSSVDGVACCPDTALWRGTSVRGAIHRDRHRSQRKQDDARGSGEVPRHMVQAEQCHAAGGGRYDARRD